MIRRSLTLFAGLFVLILAIDLLLGKMMYTAYYHMFPNASKLF